jgi:predicted alpha/beta-fold hydrolase
VRVSFVPARWLPNRHLMTVFGVLRLPPRLPLVRQRWELPDGDFVDVDRLAGATPDAPLVLVLHGLEGSSRAGYVLGVLAAARARGLAAAALNFRGCSGELNRLARFYHSGDTGDARFALERLRAERPGRALGLIGFSLGGNVAARLLAVEEPPRELRAACVVSVPFDLAGCARALDGPGLPSLIYRERFLRKLRAKACAKARRFPDAIDAERARAARSFAEFDQAVTAPLHGFAGAEDYWARASSGPLIGAVRTPLLVLAAEDDPFVPRATLTATLARARANRAVSVELFGAGGHVAFVTGPPWAPRRWAEERAVEFVAARF